MDPLSPWKTSVVDLLTVLEYDDISAATFKKSKLDLRQQDKRILKSHVDEILNSVASAGQKSLQQLDKTLEQHIGNDIKALEKENEQLAKELNDLNHEK